MYHKLMYHNEICKLLIIQVVTPTFDGLQTALRAKISLPVPTVHVFLYVHFLINSDYRQCTPSKILYSIKIVLSHNLQYGYIFLERKFEQISIIFWSNFCLFLRLFLLRRIMMNSESSSSMYIFSNIAVDDL